MSENSPAQIAHIIEEIRKFPQFTDLKQEDLHWLAERMDELHVPAGTVLSKPGDPVEYLGLMIEGEMRMEWPAYPGNPIFVAEAGEITGRLPFSRLTTFKGTSRAVLPTRMIRLHHKYFPELVQRIPLLAERLVALMSDRIRETTRMQTQQEKLMALGKLSAGLAHELNNPAAAARRAAQSLLQALEKVRDASLKLLKHSSTEEQRKAIFDFEKAAGATIAKRSNVSQDPLELSDREEQIISWLEGHSVPEPWVKAPILAEAGIETPQMESLAAVVGDTVLPDALNRAIAMANVFGLVQEIDNSTKRISDLVSAVKRYSYMDQAALQEVDLREDLENTLKIFGHRLKSGVTVVRDYAENLPRVCAYGGELNQVWTNLIDNALDAMQGKGELRVKTKQELDYAVVQIADSGSGISEENLSRIYDPFFTTKKVGEGTGLGLDAVMRIVHKHHGTIDVESKPGDTCFCVRIPFKQPKVQSAAPEATIDGKTV